MTPEQLRTIRIKMKLTQSEMAEWLHLSGDRIVRAWEAGEYKIPGSVEKCFELAGYIPEPTQTKE